jgi:hypothetical protein
MSTTINEPGNGDTVPQNFVATGGTDLMITGAQMVKGSTTVNGTVNQVQANWTATFNNVPVGSGWTLNVNNTQSSPAASVTNLTVASPPDSGRRTV